MTSGGPGVEEKGGEKAVTMWKRKRGAYFKDEEDNYKIVGKWKRGMCVEDE